MLEIPKSEGAAIRALRGGQGVSLAELAKRLGRDKGGLSKIENDIIGVSLDTVDAIADALGYPRHAAAVYCLLVSYPDLVNAETKKAVFRDLLNAKAIDR